jgi:hypothetical protein
MEFPFEETVHEVAQNFQRVTRRYYVDAIEIGRAHV